MTKRSSTRTIIYPKPHIGLYCHVKKASVCPRGYAIGPTKRIKKNNVRIKDEEKSN